MRLILILCAIFIFSDCKEKTIEPSLSFSKMKGNWFPDEFVENNGNINKTNLILMNTFGVYAGGFQMEEDGIYYPISGLDSLNFEVKIKEKGIAKYAEKGNSITFNGIWKIEFEVIKLENNELWLSQVELGAKSRGILKMVRK